MLGFECGRDLAKWLQPWTIKNSNSPSVADLDSLNLSGSSISSESGSGFGSKVFTTNN
jgi:hypothetical protein